MKIIPAFEENRTKALALLQKVSLPVEDIKGSMSLFVLQDGEDFIGTIGYETDGQLGLLRSLSVSEAHRGKGRGVQLVSFLEAHAKAKGLRSVYLLTTTAAAFFSKLGYAIVSRTETPLFIRQSSEFSSVCPASADVMKKDLV